MSNSLARQNGVLAGVCGGLAERFGISALIMRIIFVALTLLGGSGVILYLVLWLVMPMAD